MTKFFGTDSSARAKEIYEKIEDTLDQSMMKNITLGKYISYGLLSDAKRLGFMMARHKFVAKMLTGYSNVLEIGCQEGFTSFIMSQSVGRLTAVDFFEEHIAEANKHMAPHLRNVTFKGHDILDGPVEGDYDGAFSLDVFEHIDPAQEQVYFDNIKNSLIDDGVFIVGIPSLESQKYASPQSKAGHINCKTGEDLRVLCEKNFKRVFMFSMNDEVLHTGFFPMSNYLFGLCVAPRRS